MSNSSEELEHLLSLLKIEMDEDRFQYQQKMQQLPLSQKREEGLVWYPLIIKDSYYGMGERLIVEIERVATKNLTNQFQTGKLVRFFSNQETGESEGITGIISMVRDNFMKLVFFADELPEWSNKGKLGVELLFDEGSYKEMEAAVKQVMKARNCRLEILRDILLGHKKPSKTDTKAVIDNYSLNESQHKAIENILQQEDVAVIHGPPGTGKTTTLVAAIAEAVKREGQVLVTAPSNTAVDLLTEKLAEKKINVLRIGNPARVHEEQLKHTLDVKVAEHRDSKRIKELRRSANELRSMALKYKRNFGREERVQRKVVLREARKMADEAAAIENYIIEDVIERAQVLTCTLVGSANSAISDKFFSTVFIDEAAQALEPACWIPVLRAGKVVFAGDHFQLPPTVKSYEAAKNGLSKTLFEKVIERQSVDVMLQIQYRMNEKIMQFSNKQFYRNQLKASDIVKNWVLKDTENTFITDSIQFVDTAGCGFTEAIDPKTLSTFNREEAELVCTHYKYLLEALWREQAETLTLSVGIIAPYKAQVEILKELFEKEEESVYPLIKLSVNTVDGFQGQERDIIYISLVRSNFKGEIGFLGDIRRMNVALTRAKKKLVVIGDSATLGKHDFYRKFLDYIDEMDAYKSAYTYLNY